MLTHLFNYPFLHLSPCLGTIKIFQCFRFLLLQKQGCILALCMKMPFPTHSELHCKASRAWHRPSLPVHMAKHTHPLQPGTGTALNSNPRCNETILLHVSSKAYLVEVRDPLMNHLALCLPSWSWFATSNPDIISFPHWAPFLPQIHSAQLYAIPFPKPRQHHTGNAGHPCQISASAQVTLGLKPASGWKWRARLRAPLTILYLKAPSNFSPRWQDPLLSMTTTT